MEKVGERFRKERDFHAVVKQADRNAKLGEAVALGVFRREIIDLALSDHTGLLAGIDERKLDESDLMSYHHFKERKLSITMAQKQLGILNQFPAEGAHSRKLLNYMLYRLRKEAKQKRKPENQPELSGM